MPEKHFKYHHVETEGCDGVSYVTVENQKFVHVLYAFILTYGRRSVSHQEIFELAVEEGIIPGNHEPNGGGVYNFRTREVSASINFGLPDEVVNDRIIDFFQRKQFEKRC